QMSIAAAATLTKVSAAMPRISVEIAPDPTSRLKPNRVLPAVSKPLSVRFSDRPADAELTAVRTFQEPLVPIGGHASAAENRALADAIVAFASQGDPEQTADLSDFLNRFPQSRWRASLLANLGAVWR